VALRGWLVAFLSLFDISAIVWLAIFACLSLLWQSKDGAVVTSRDWAFTVVVALVSALPFAALSAAALCLAGLCGMVTSPKGSEARRAGAILVSLSAFFFWGRVFLALGAGPMLSADAQFVSWISGLSVSGNIVTSVNGSTFAIAPGCSSLHGISLAFVLWTTALAWFGRPLTQRLLGLLAIAISASILVNGIRLTLIGWYPQDFDYWHIGNGAAIIGWLALIAITAVIYVGLRCELAEA
jgi:exosortase/archaeosortase family protein